jgi:hypothetical protein
LHRFKKTANAFCVGSNFFTFLFSALVFYFSFFTRPRVMQTARSDGFYFSVSTRDRKKMTAVRRHRQKKRRVFLPGVWGISPNKQHNVIIVPCLLRTETATKSPFLRRLASRIFAMYERHEKQKCSYDCNSFIAFFVLR